jgi:phage terminase small subunit
MPALKNPRHEQFANFIAAGATPTKAYALAGYKEATADVCGRRLLRNAPVLLRVQELQAEANRSSAKKAQLDRHWVLATLKENVERAMQAIPVKGADGNETGEYKWEGNVANRGLELLGKELGMFREKLDMTMKAEATSVSVILAKHCSLDQLEAMRAEGVAQIAAPVEVQAEVVEEASATEGGAGPGKRAARAVSLETQIVKEFPLLFLPRA